MDTKRTVRWRCVSWYEEFGWSCWEVDGERIIIHGPKHRSYGSKGTGNGTRKAKPPVPEDERILSILDNSERRRTGRRRKRKEVA